MCAKNRLKSYITATVHRMFLYIKQIESNKSSFSLLCVSEIALCLHCKQDWVGFTSALKTATVYCGTDCTRC